MQELDLGETHCNNIEDKFLTKEKKEPSLIISTANYKELPRTSKDSWQL